jgi:hypothetical protein
MKILTLKKLINILLNIKLIDIYIKFETKLYE